MTLGSRFGARCSAEGVHFRVWAPGWNRVDVVFEGPNPPPCVRLEPQGDGLFAGSVAEARPGDRYRYRLDGEAVIPDPASRCQPEGVHGPSEIVDPAGYSWHDATWTPPSDERLVEYELHVGTFTPAGTFAGVRDRLGHLRDLGVTAIELMPVAAFPGRRNWGYDGACLYAPARCYGRPEELRALVDAAHRTGIAVLLDVVYNHLGPDGAYLAVASPSVFSTTHTTPWGRAINLDGPESGQVRDFLIDNAIHWLDEYHLDGLRLDATHALIDDSPRHFLAELTARVRRALSRRVLLIAEDHRNQARMVRSTQEGGWGLDSEWTDDFHHQVRRITAGDRAGCFRDFTDSSIDLARTVRQGWLFTGQHSSHYGGPRGSDPSGLAPARFTVFLQNHDQVGNRALGERLHHQIEPAAYRAATTLLLTAPETPLLFMGQEWATSAPFQFFTDHEPGLGRRVTDGRRRDLGRLGALPDGADPLHVPDPQDPATFERCRLDWSELDRPAHAAVLRLHRALLELRRREPLLHRPDWVGFHADANPDGGLWLTRRIGDDAILVLIQLRGGGIVDPSLADGPFPWERLAWSPVLSTEDSSFVRDPLPIQPVGDSAGHRFARPGGLVLRGRADDSPG